MTENIEDIEETLGKRSPVYGPYGGQIMVRNKLMKIMTDSYYELHGVPMDDRSEQYLWDIVNKLSRIAASPDHLDSWHDIQGYAKLIEKDILLTKEIEDADK